jgi:uncharacterized damage-inducible protein DinB
MSHHRMEVFLKNYDREHDTTMRVLRAYPTDKLDLKPSEKSKTARELAWVFVSERGLGTHLWGDAFANGMPSGGPPPAPDDWNELLTALDKASNDYRALIADATDEQLDETITFFVAPKTMGKISRHEMIWMLLHDQIHHRGQFSVYLRMAGGKVPSIYGPTADEPWI